MPHPTDVIARVHNGSVYCEECIHMAHQRCTEKYDDCPDGLDSTFYIFRSDEWWDTELRSMQHLQCEMCFIELAAYYNDWHAMRGITRCKTLVIEHQLPSGEMFYGYRWDGGTIVQVFEQDNYGNDHELQPFSLNKGGEPPSRDVVIEACKSHYLSELDRMGV